MLGDVNKLFIFKSLLTTPSNVLSLQLEQTFLPIIWIFTEREGDGITRNKWFIPPCSFWTITNSGSFKINWFWNYKNKILRINKNDYRLQNYFLASKMIPFLRSFKEKTGTGIPGKVPLHCQDPSGLQIIIRWTQSFPPKKTLSQWSLD